VRELSSRAENQHASAGEAYAWRAPKGKANHEEQQHFENRREGISKIEVTQTTGRESVFGSENWILKSMEEDKLGQSY
jgi:predicted NUDIX family NTP pyrophosphohydrolase